MRKFSTPVLVTELVEILIESRVLCVRDIELMLWMKILPHSGERY